MANSTFEVDHFITVLQWNCRSLDPKLDAFKFLAHNNNCDAFALCETWLSPDMNLQFHDFNIIRLDRGDSRGGGVLLGIRKSHSFYRVNLPHFPDIEVVACEAILKGKSLCIASVYIPPKVAVNRKQLTDIFSAMPAPRLIMGDFNSHGIGWGEPYDDNRAALIYDLCDNFNMTILNNGEVTRLAGSCGNGSRLDLTLCSNSLSLDCNWNIIPDPHGSDHLPIKVSIASGFKPPQGINVKYDLTRNIDWTTYQNAINEALMSVEELPPLEEYNFISNLILDSALQAQTRSVPGTSVRRKPPSPWWDEQCSDVYRRKSNAFKVFRKRGTPEHFKSYLELENEFKSLIKAKKRGYWRHFVEGLSRETPMTTLWNTARRMRNRQSNNESEEYSDRWILKFARKVCPDSVPAQLHCRETASAVDENSQAFSMAEFSIALLSSGNSAPGDDGIKFNLLKNLPDVAKRRMLNLFNHFLEHNIVPDAWRRVKVIAIKKPDKPASDHNSYRPISMLSCVRKLFEKMILYRLDKWVETNHLLSDTQYGFRRGKGTNDCLALLSTDIQLAFAKKEQMASVFLDIKGAFDSVSIEILSDKLNDSGLSPLLNNFLHNLLSEKHMSFSHGNSTDLRFSYMGLPQGSCLSPLLYNFYVREIDNCLSDNCTLRQLADDGVISTTAPNENNLQGPLQDTLDNLSAWALKLGIDFSTEKTELVVFSRKHSPAKPKLQLLGKPITHSMCFKYLGVLFDSKCTWKPHIEYLQRKCQQRINFLRTITGTYWGAHPQDLLTLYRTTILSVLEYGSFCFQSAAKTHFIKLERIQYRCIRIALGCMHSTHTMSLEVLAGMLPLSDRFSELSLRLLTRCEVMNPLVIENFDRLLDLNHQNRFMTIYYTYITHDVSPSQFNPSRVSFSDFGNSVHFDMSMMQEIRGIPEHHRALIVPSIFSFKYGHVNPATAFFTDGSLIEDSTGFGVFNAIHSASRMLKAPASVYVAELAAIHYALETIASLPSDSYFIFSDSLSCVEAIRSQRPVRHSSYLLTKIRDILSALSSLCFVITFVWVPSHCSIPGNEKADSLAKVGAMEGDIYERHIAFNEFFHIFRQQSLVSWQNKWSEDCLGRWLYSIIPKVSKQPWFKGLDVSRDFIRVMSRLMSNHYNLNAHLSRIELRDSGLCECGTDYQDADHVIWSCAEYREVRSVLFDSLRARGRPPNVPVRDILAKRDLVCMELMYVFLRKANISL
jgi:ribonuclease HI